MSEIKSKKHPIKIASLRSGLSSHLIRMWERRYGAVEPDRTETNRRLYSDDDIDRLILLKRATDEGESIGQIANLSYEELRAMVPARSPFPSRAVTDGGVSIPVEKHLERCLEAVRDFDGALLQARLTDAWMTQGRQVLLERLLHPLLEKIGQMWSDGEIKVAHEHLASSVVRSLLGSIVSATQPSGAPPTLIATTLAGQLHEFGALMAAATASALGWKVIYLGPNMPSENVANAVAQTAADAVALSIVYPPDDPQIKSELLKLGQMLPDSTSLLVGGRAAGSYAELVTHLGGHLVANLRTLRQELEAIRVTRSNVVARSPVETNREQIN